MNSALARSIADLSNQWRNRFWPWAKSSKSGHLRRGVRGEKLACRFLKRNGYKILFRNFRGRSGGEIDVVCRDDDTLVFIEVKTRAREDFGRPFAAVDREKRKRISRGALAWLRMLDNPDILVEIADWASAEVRAAAMQQAMASGAYGPLRKLLAAPFRATVISHLP